MNSTFQIKIANSFQIKMGKTKKKKEKKEKAEDLNNINYKDIKIRRSDGGKKSYLMLQLSVEFLRSN